MYDDVVVRRIRENELDSLTDAHLICFPEYYLTHLGRRIVKETYRQYFKSALLLPIGAYQGETMVGFVAGSFPGGSIDVDFWRNNFMRVVWAMIWGLIRGDKVIWSGLAARSRRIVPAIAKRFRKKRSPSVDVKVQTTSKIAWLVSIAVMPDARGCGAARALMDYFIKQELEHGATDIYLCAYKANARACAFYEKVGYARINEGPLLYTYAKKIG